MVRRTPDAWEKAAAQADTDAVVAAWGYKPLWSAPVPPVHDDEPDAEPEGAA